MEDNNITRTHIAMEAMKTLIIVSAKDNTSLIGRIKRFLGFGNPKIKLPSPDVVAMKAYEYADAMLEERDNKDNERAIKQV